MPSHAFLEHSGVLAFAHRGDSEAAPENTAAAFESAVSHGFQYLETDVHCTRDGVLLAFHDDRLDRVTSDRGLIAALDYPVIARARVGDHEPIPLMEELLGDFPHTRFNIDPKSDAAVGPLIEVIHRTGAQERVCIGSFSDKRLARVRTALPKVCTSMATLETTRARLASIGLPVGVLRAACALRRAAGYLDLYLGLCRRHHFRLLHGNSTADVHPRRSHWSGAGRYPGTQPIHVQPPHSAGEKCRVFWLLQRGGQSRRGFRAGDDGHHHPPQWQPTPGHSFSGDTVFCWHVLLSAGTRPG